MRRLLLALLAGCSSSVVVESHDDPVAESAIACAADSEACEACLAEASEGSCSSAVLACEDEPDCGAFDGCHDGERAWRLWQCVAEHPRGERAWRGLVGCACDACAAECCATCSSPWGTR